MPKRKLLLVSNPLMAADVPFNRKQAPTLTSRALFLTSPVQHTCVGLCRCRHAVPP